MAGGPPPKSSSSKITPSSSSKKSRWESKTNHSSQKPQLPSSSSGGNSKPLAPPQQPSPRPTPSTNPAINTSPSLGPHPVLGQSGGLARFQDPPQLGPTPPPTYGFHMLDRRPIVLADGSVRSYFALPPDYQDFVPPVRRLVELAGGSFPHGPEFGGPMGGFRGEREEFGRGTNQDYWNSLGLDERRTGEGLLKRKFGEEEEKSEITRQRQQLLQYGNAGFGNPVGGGELAAGTSGSFGRDGDDFRPSKYTRLGLDYNADNAGFKHNNADPVRLKKAFLNFAKMIYENAAQKKSYLDNGKQGRLQCIACGGSSKDFPDMHSLIMHTYHSNNPDLLVDHLGLHKALCVLMGWNYSQPPDNSKTYQLFSADEAAANQDDLVLWPPLVIIHNTTTGKGRDGRMEGLGNKAMDNKLRELGISGGKSKSLYGREGHLGVTLVKFSGDQTGLKEALKLAEHLEKENHGRQSWARVQLLPPTADDENNPQLVKVDEKNKEKRRILYGYLGTASDIDKLDFETRKKIAMESCREVIPAN